MAILTSTGSTERESGGEIHKPARHAEAAAPHRGSDVAPLSQQGHAAFHQNTASSAAVRIGRSHPKNTRTRASFLSCSLSMGNSADLASIAAYSLTCAHPS